MQVDVREAIYLAAILHDIGKFWQRASGKVFSETDNLSASTKNLIADLCPEYNGKHSHYHVLWTSEFFEKFNSLLPQTTEFEGKTVQIGNLSARHHKTDLSGLDAIIAYADKLSSGHDRREKSEAELAEIEQRDYEKFKKTRLQSVFDNLFDEKVSAHFQIAPLTITDESFPKVQHSVSLDDKAVDEYRETWINFENALKNFPRFKYSFRAFSSTLLSTLKTYLWAIPSSTMEQPDVSLYDHLKTTAAIAVSLFDSQKEHGKLPSGFDGIKFENAKRFSLIGGDFSGIQNFIYQISSKSAAKTLKGRSFYLQLILDSVLSKLLEAYNVQDAHVLYASGGGFYLLVANDSENWEKAQQIFRKCNQELLDKYDGSLYLAVGKTDFEAQKLYKESGYPKLIERVQEEIEKDKQHKFASSLIKETDFFEPQELAGLGTDFICDVTGVDLTLKNRVLLFEDDNEIKYASKSAKEQIELGRKLKGANYLVRFRRHKTSVDGKGEFEPLDFGYSYQLYSELPSRDKLRDAEKIIAFNNPTNFLEPKIDLDDCARTYQFYGAAHIPEDVKDNPVEFTDIAEDGVINALGIIRMDVDNLGKAFKDGFRHKDRDLSSISRSTTLSSQLEWFFSGYLHHLLSHEFEPDPKSDVFIDSKTDSFKNHIYPVYAGGDDVFILSRWDLAPIVATRIYDAFRKFTNANSKMTISGGITIIDPKAPIHKGAYEAGNAESDAKKMPPTETKNAISFFEMPLGWEDFYLAKDIAFELKVLIEKMGSRAVLGLLRDTVFDYSTLKRLYETGKVTTDPLFGRWRWRAAYQLARLKKQYKLVENELDKTGIGGEIFLTGSFKKQKPKRLYNSNGKLIDDLIELLPLVTKWLSLLTRNTKKEKQS